MDYEDFLRQRGLKMWPREDPRRNKLVALRPATVDDVAAWARQVRESSGPGKSSGKATYPEIAANGALLLIAVASAILDRQLDAQAKAFEKDGGFAERLYRKRSEKRRDG